MNRLLLYTFFALLMGGCRWRDAAPIAPVSADGYRPIYVSRDEIEKFIVTTPQPLKSPGKIYIKDDFLFVNEQNKGVHVFDNKDPLNPKKVAFLQIPGNADIAVRGTTLYADNGRDLLTIDVSAPTQAKLINRLKDAFPNQEYPPQTNVNFECIDNSKGIVIGWEKIPNGYNLKCYR